MTVLNDLADAMSNNEAIQPLMDIITQIMELPEESLNDEMVGVISGMITGAFTEQITENAINDIVRGLDGANVTRATAIENFDNFKQTLTDLLEELKPSQNKRTILENSFATLFNIFDSAMERYHAYDIVLPIKLDGDAKTPTYAHETDAAADLYAVEDITLPAHSLSNFIHTGVHIQLPEHWVAYVIPRSSIGLKTGLRLSNSVGCIDAPFRGEIGVIYDNISDSDYTIKAGDRIAQLIVAPAYHFKAQVVDILNATERGEGGYGSTGK